MYVLLKQIRVGIGMDRLRLFVTSIPSLVNKEIYDRENLVGRYGKVLGELNESL